MASFFAPNGRNSDERSTLQHPQNGRNSVPRELIHSITPPCSFLDPNAFYPAVKITDPSILKAVLEATYEPVKSWHEICTTNTSSTAQTGSFIEFIHGHEIGFGVVLREPYARFNQYHNRMIVLSLHNELVKVHPQDITFCMHGVLDQDAISPSHILKNRFSETLPERAKVVQILHLFMATVAENREQIPHSMQIVHSNISSTDRVAPVCLSEVATLVAAQTGLTFSSYFHQSALLMAMYLEMCGDASRWIVPGSVPSERVTNLSLHDASNTLPPIPMLFATPIHVLDDVSRFLLFDTKQMADFDGFLKMALARKTSYDDLVLQFEIWDATRFLSALRAMLYAAVYPHSQIVNKLSAMTVFGTVPSRASIVALLAEMGIYDNPQNPLTDPYMSAGIWGKVKKHSLVASSTTDLDASSLQHSAAVEAARGKFDDKFPHLRRARSFFYDTTAYILPGPTPNMAISMEEINSRRFLINIHVADLASRLSPASATFSKWSASTAFLENTPELLGVKRSTLLPPEATNDVFFRKTRPRTPKHYFAVGDYSQEKVHESRGETQTCMTITFEYNSYLEDPMKSLADSASVSFDALQDFQFKALDAKVLEKSLTGKLEPSIFGKLKLFQHTEAKASETEPVDGDDHYSLNFLYNVLRRHFKARNRNYAVSLNNRSRPRDVHKSLAADGDTMRTTVSLGDEEVHDKATFLRSEAQILAGRLVSEYTQKNRIPVFYDCKPFLDNDPDPAVKDEVLIRHDNMMHPNFSAVSYFQIPYGRDVSGHVSTSGHIFGHNFLGFGQVTTAPEKEHAALGLRKGSVNVVDAAESMKAYLNQLQLLEHVHFTQTANAQLYKDASKFSHLRALGYSLHGAMRRDLIEEFSGKLSASLRGAEYFAAVHRKHWVVRAVESGLHSTRHMKCVVTKVSRDMDFGADKGDGSIAADVFDSDDVSLSGSECQVVRAYCEELGIEVDLLVCEPGVMVGSEMRGEVVYVDSGSGAILLG